MSKRIIIIGAGLAGLTAAHAAAREGATVLVVDRGPIGIGTNSALANGFFAGPSEKYSPDDYIRDALRAGRGLNRESQVRLVAREAPSAFQFLRSAGVLLKERGAQRSVVSPDPSVIPGALLMRKMTELVKGLDGIHVLPGFYVSEIPCSNGRVCGIRGFNRRGEEMDIDAPAVLLATGGAGAIYRHHDNQKKILGQGYALAARAGLDLRDMEFVQFFPLVLADPKLPALIVYPPFAREAKIVTSSGENILEKHGLGDVNDAIIKKRDAFSALLFEEGRKGPVCLDLSGVPASAWDVHPLAIFRRLRFDFRSNPVAVSPAVHFMMGGVRTDNQGRTDIEGLFACGEIQWGLHGANRMGGNAMTECVVSGAIAGRSAADWVLGDIPVPSCREKPRRITGEGRVAGSGEIQVILSEIRTIAWECAGIVRSGENLKKGLEQLAAVKGRLETIRAEGFGVRALLEDTRAAALTLHAILLASLGRQESRGSFLRSDFPAEDDSRWRRNSSLSYDAEKNEFALQHLPVESA
ncbi:MAG TPA: FAD-dependent oxidoreductase [Syntrophales bacterium]|nr:FAD-dependent oxidoreductase [Syntrophales bacterium]